MLKTAASFVLACSEPRRTDLVRLGSSRRCGLADDRFENSARWLVKMAPNCVLGLHESSTYPKGTPAVPASPAALLDDHFDQPYVVQK